MAVSWSASLGIVLLTFRAIRKNPTSSAFDIPGSQFPADDEEAFAPSDTDSPSQGYRASGDYYAAEGESRLFGESVKGYGGGRGGEFHPVVKDPFEDQQKGEYEMRYDGADPYEAIRKVGSYLFFPNGYELKGDVRCSQWTFIDLRIEPASPSSSSSFKFPGFSFLASPSRQSFSPH
jgi:hypothetical protein